MKLSTQQHLMVSGALALLAVGFFVLTANAFFSYQTNNANADYNVEQSLLQTINGDVEQAATSMSWAVEARERANQRVMEMAGFGAGGVLCLGFSAWLFKKRRVV